MALEDILLDIEERKKRELAAIEEEYSKKIAAIEKEVALGIEDLSSRYQKKKEEELKSREKRSEDLISLEARRIMAKRKSDLLDEALRKTDLIISDYLKGMNYQDLLLSMHDRARELLGTEPVALVDSGDKLARTVKDFETRVVNDGFLQGAIFKSPDGSREVDLTLPVISRIIRENVASRLSEKLGE
ncbi:MAG: hypothetical protein M1410_04790 [Candidatus Thermoplasmatota archaeon]|jgi:vacuolar-type H+-ATPase subunit E/Vma4|nr:hypothetical protein [Candidatus Thermoplasmatota archaeon]